MPKKLIGMQLQIESTALTIFHALRESKVCPVLTDLLTDYEKDEARHVGLGVQLLPTLMKKMGPAESVAFTYNDPVIFAEYAIDVADACRAQGIKTVAVTAGYISPEPRRELFAHMDAANVDLKAFTDEFYVKVTGAKLDPVLDTLRYLCHETDVWTEITTLLFPGRNDGDDEIRALSQWVARNLGTEVPLHFTAFHPDWKMTDVPATPLSTVRRAREIAMQTGLQHVYTGNVSDPQGGRTHCTKCGATLIARDGYRIIDYRLTDAGECKNCGHALAGRFERYQGSFGSRRIPVRLARFAA
jgi:pyruvate formate lyase activating enzyme